MKVSNLKKTLLTAVSFAILSMSFGAHAATLSGVVNVNTASAEQLALLPGIGEARANAIIAQRKDKPFAKKEELLLIKGIGDKMFAKLAPYVATQGETTLKEEKDAAEKVPTATTASTVK